MAITAAVANSFKTQVLQSCMDFSVNSFSLTSVAAATGVYTGTITGGASNAFAGMIFRITGFLTAANNGTFQCTASNATTLTLTNAQSATETHAGTAASGDTFKLALYTSSATMSKATTNYVVTNEVGNSGSYAAGGGTLTSSTPVLSTDTAVCDYADISFTTATITARGALIYNSSKVIGAAGGAAVQVLDFGSDQTSTAGTFSIVFPTPAAGTAILQLV